jgi:hypothetical protein
MDPSDIPERPLAYNILYITHLQLPPHLPASLASNAAQNPSAAQSPSYRRGTTRLRAGLSHDQGRPRGLAIMPSSPSTCSTPVSEGEVRRGTEARYQISWTPLLTR